MNEQRSWRRWSMEKGIMSVAGCIDSNGEIRARPSKEITVHPPDLMRGRRWRWLVGAQEFMCMAPRSVEESNDRMLMALTKEEHFAICDWLVRHGYADDRIFPRWLPHQIERFKSAKGGYTKASLAQMGVPWPPPKGWKEALLTGKPMAETPASHPCEVPRPV